MVDYLTQSTHMKFTRLLGCSLLLALAGCQSANYVYETPNDRPWSIPPKGTVVELLQPLVFSPGSSRAYIQDGEAKTIGGFDRFKPWCQFYLYEPQEAMKVSRTIQPDQFTIVRSGQGISFALTNPVNVVSNSTSYLMASDNAGPQILTTTMRLNSEKQPQVQDLKCSTTNGARRDNYVSVNQIRKTLGRYASLQLPPVE